MPFIVEFMLNFNSCNFFLGTNTSVKFVAKIARFFRGQIDPWIIFGRDMLNFIAGLAQWRGLAQTLLSFYDYSMPLIMKVLFCRHTVNEKEISFSSICHVVLHNRERLFPFSFTQNRVIFNPLTPRSYQHEISPNKILTLSSKQLMRIFKLIR